MDVRKAKDYWMLLAASFLLMIAIIFFLDADIQSIKQFAAIGFIIAISFIISSLFMKFKGLKIAYISLVVSIISFVAIPYAADYAYQYWRNNRTLTPEEKQDIENKVRAYSCRSNAKKIMLEYLQKCAELGYKESQAELGRKYYIGDGVRQNSAKAFEWYTKAAEQGEPTALIFMGNYYKNNLIVSDKEDMATAQEYYGMACDLGNQEGCKKYADLNANGVEFEIKMRQYMRKLRESDNSTRNS